MNSDIRTRMDWTYAYGKSLLHPRTIFKTLAAFFTGFFLIIGRSVSYAQANELKELKEKNPTRWDEERARRRFYLWSLVGIDLVTLIFLWFAKYKYDLPGNFQRFGPLFWMLSHIAVCIWMGKQEPILARVQTKRMAGEELIRTITNEMTLTQAAVKDGATAEIAVPPHSLKHTPGYSVTVRVHQKGNPVTLLTDLPRLAHKLHKGTSQVFTYQDPDDNSLVKWTVLEDDPWKREATSNPLALRPRRFNIWKEIADLGYLPDFSAWVRTLISEGDGGGILVGGAPRKGKTVFLKNLIVYLLLDVMCNIHMIDGKDLDFPDLKGIAKTYIGEDGMDDVEFLRKSTAFLEGMKREILRRKPLIKAEDATAVSEELCKKLNLKLEWIIIDELAVITEDLLATHKQEVMHFIGLLQYIVRMGPAFGVFFIGATQRPSDKSVPDSIRSLIIWKIAFYISTQPGSMAILGKAGPEYRADWLPHDIKLFKGVALSIGDGRVRGHNVTKQQFRDVCTFARALRAGEIQEPDTEDEYPELVKIIISIFEEHNQTRVYTSTILEELSEHGISHTSTSLAAALSPFGISPGNVKIGGKELKGYRLEHLKAAPKIPSRPVYTVSPSVAETSGDDAIAWVATTDGDDEDG